MKKMPTDKGIDVLTGKRVATGAGQRSASWRAR